MCWRQMLKKNRSSLFFGRGYCKKSFETSMVEIKLSPKAELKYNQILDYTLEEFGETTEKRFEECFLES